MNKELMIELYTSAKEVEKKTGIPALFQIAQAVQESGWDLEPILDYVTKKNSFNIYGIKLHTNDNNFVRGWTKEFENGTMIYKIAKFQSYENYEGCFRDHAKLLQEDIGNYKTALEKYKKDNDLTAYVKSVSQTYATDPKYSVYILSLIETLKKYFINDWIAEKEEAKTTMMRLGIITDFTQKEIDIERLAVILNRLLKHTGGA